MSDEQEAVVTLFTPIDRQSNTWAKLRKYIEARTETLRRQNDGDLDPIATAKVRGQIASLKNLLTLASEPAPANVADEEAE